MMNRTHFDTASPSTPLDAAFAVGTIAALASFVIAIVLALRALRSEGDRS